MTVEIVVRDRSTAFPVAGRKRRRRRYAAS